jgi:hypothetical protein
MAERIACAVETSFTMDVQDIRTKAWRGRVRLPNASSSNGSAMAYWRTGWNKTANSHVIKIAF